VPLVVFAGESPINAKWYNQAIDQAPLVAATGAHYVRAHSAKLMHEYVREAFYVARYERRPTVLGVPYDLQKVTYAGPDYKPSASYIPKPGRTPPNPERRAGRQDRERQASYHHRRPRRGGVRRAGRD
jgi:acetolactate synthase I/II/III large subunit